MAPLNPRWRRRLPRLAAALLAIVAVAVLWWLAPDAPLRREATGWLLFAGLVVLLSLRLKRALRMLPLGSAYAWTQVHAYLGIVLAAVLWLHGDFSAAAGPFWWFLFVLVWGSLLSGVLVLAAARWLPRGLRNSQRIVLYERIPQQRALVADQMAGVYRQLVAVSPSDLVFRQTADALFATVNQREHTARHLVGSRYPFQAAAQRVAAIRRYLGAQEEQLLDRLLALYQQKVELDAQESVQWLYRCLLVAHRVLAVTALVPVLLHVVFAYAYVDF